ASTRRGFATDRPESSSATRRTTCSDERADQVKVPALLAARRSIRAFRPDPVARDVIDALVEAACLAPAPHHSRPWRWVVVDTPDGKQSLANGMGERWATDLRSDGLSDEHIAELVHSSRH